MGALAAEHVDWLQKLAASKCCQIHVLCPLPCGSLLDGGLDQEASNCVGVHIGSWPPVLQVPIALQLDRQGNADGCTTVSHAKPAG